MIADYDEAPGYPSRGTPVAKTKFKTKRCPACGEKYTLRCRSCELFPVRAERLQSTKGVTGI